ncbi:thioredoxin family protein [Sulfolobus tengchongensis]|uniref:Thioredoxin family protein n=1 Tax=Sulfolobus tengchongensis TaxID=207809 RepID=A0AAX4L2Y1_9CREN
MSYDYVIKQYLSAIKAKEGNIKIQECKGEELFYQFKDFVNVETIQDCNRPFAKVIKDNRIYFTYYGIPIVNELWPFLNSLIRISNNVVNLDEKELELAKKIKGNVKLFVTPDCTKCPITAEFLYQVAQINENVELEIYDVTEYEEEKEKYRVLSVPKIVFNSRVEIPGGFPSIVILKMMLRALQE